MWDRIERLIGTENLAMLARKRVGVIGVGSGGSFAALSLAMSGVRHFVLIDPDTLEETNVPRHAADRRYLGWNKAEAVADLILARSPEAHITTIPGRFEDHAEALADLDLVIVGVDNENAKYRINQLCLERRLTAIYAGVYERGEGGDVVIILPYNGPCYACWAEELRSGAALVDDPQELDYGMIGETGTLEAEPGLWLHVARIASAQTDIGLNALLEGTPVYRMMPGNTVIMANSAIEIVPGEITLPYAAEWFAIERNPNCMVCGHFYEDSAVSLADLLATNGLGIDSDTDDEER